jgi:hypothetical protein
VQMKLRTTEVSPISGGRPNFMFDASVFESAVGFSVFNPNGEAAGAVTIEAIESRSRTSRRHPMPATIR